MMEYFSYKKYKKYREKKEEEKEKGKLKEEASSPAASSSKASPVTQLKEKLEEKPVLDADDESFFERLTSGNLSLVATHDDDDDEGARPPLPPRVKTPDLTWDSDSESFVKSPKAEDEAKDEAKDKDGDKRPEAPTRSSSKKVPSAADKIGRRISLLVRRPKKEVKPTNLAVPEPEADKEKADLTRVLDDLNLSAKNNRAFSLSDESSELLRKFTLVLKDLVNGVPTAVDDMRNLLDDHDGLLAKNYEKLPSGLKKLVTQLPTKLTSTLAPELLAVAAESQGIKHTDNSKSGLKSTAKSLLMPKSMGELISKPGAIVSMLKAIMNALKLRWPAFAASNVIWSIAIFTLLFVCWYCHKRGREVRLEKERSDVSIDAGARVEELPDDPALPEASSSQAAPGHPGPEVIMTPPDDEGPTVKLPPPPVGPGATGRKSPTPEK